MRYLARPVWAGAILALLSCEEAPDPNAQPAGWDDALRLTPAVDLNPDPHVLEVELVARVADVKIKSGAPTRAYTYDGKLPGPLLRLRQGDRLIVHFKNELPEATSIHWHGIRLENAMDGSPPHTQPDILPGESFDYDFIVPEAGTYWYHPHLATSAQVGFGLYGALVVDPPEGSAEEGNEAERALGDEVVVVLSDIGLDDQNQLQPADASGPLATLFGREGDYLLANGKYLASLKARPGVRQRWRFINAARSRYFQLDFAGQTFTQIGGDAGMLATPLEMTKVVVVPGGRADVVITPEGATPKIVSLQWVPFDRGFGSTEFRYSADVFRVSLSGERGTSPPLPRTALPVEPLSADGAMPVDIELTQENTGDETVVLGINGVPFAEAPPILARVGETQLWTVTNRMQWSHPFHLHGFFFQVLDEAGAPITEWRDTVDVPHGDGKLRFLVRYDNRPGMWMFHCHILDHADAGMMGMVELLR